MDLVIENDKLVIYEDYIDRNYVQKHRTRPIAKLPLQDLAKALKPYLDSIDNCECGKK